MNKAAKQYMKELRRLFPFRSEKEKLFLADIKSAVLELAMQNPTIGYDTLCLEIGRPQDLISSYYSEVDSDYLRKKLNIFSFIRKGVIIITLIVFIFIAYRGVLVYDAYKDAQDAIITKELIVIE